MNLTLVFLRNEKSSQRTGPLSSSFFPLPALLNAPTPAEASTIACVFLIWSAPAFANPDASPAVTGVYSLFVGDPLVLSSCAISSSSFGDGLVLYWLSMDLMWLSLYFCRLVAFATLKKFISIFYLLSLMFKSYIFYLIQLDFGSSALIHTVFLLSRVGTCWLMKKWIYVWNPLKVSSFLNL